MSDPITVYISIGNSDDKLSQSRWAEFYREVDDTISFFTGYREGSGIHGRWLSSPEDHYQNACWCAEIRNPEGVKRQLAKIAAAYGQDSIAWTVAPVTEFIKGNPYVGQ